MTYALVALRLRYEMSEEKSDQCQLPGRKPVNLPARKNPSAYPLPLDAARGYGWNACLDEIAKLGPLYTHPAPADSAEVERLREGISKHWKVVCDQRAELETLRAQLSEAHALLGAIAGWTEKTRAAVLEAFQDELNESASYEWYDSAIADLMKLIQALPASADPSAPAAAYPNRLCHIDYTAHPYLCGCLEGDKEAQRRYDEKFVKPSAEPGAEPSAPVERNDRASWLNAWFLSLEPGRQAVLREDKWMLANAAFEAGYARAALERKPS